MKDFMVIIAGGRDFEEPRHYQMMCKEVDEFLGPYEDNHNIYIVSGMAKGADTLGIMYAESRGYSYIPFPADWDRYGKGAGHIRNQEMSDVSDALVAFWDKESRGTKDMIARAIKLGLVVKVVNYCNKCRQTGFAGTNKYNQRPCPACNNTED
jgi:rubrerythrin